MTGIRQCCEMYCKPFGLTRLSRTERDVRLRSKPVLLVTESDFRFAPQSGPQSQCRTLSVRAICRLSVRFRTPRAVRQPSTGRRISGLPMDKLLKNHDCRGSRHNGGHKPLSSLNLLMFLAQNIPCAMVLTVSFGLSPVTRRYCHRRRGLLRDLAPALGRQDHTTSPSAIECRSSCDTIRVHRIPSRVRDDASAPRTESGWLAHHHSF
jgi:hypothetical protein